MVPRVPGLTFLRINGALLFKRLTAQQKLPKFGFHTRITKLWPTTQSSVLSAKFDCPETSMFSLAYDCESGLMNDCSKGFICLFSTSLGLN